MRDGTGGHGTISRRAVVLAAAAAALMPGVAQAGDFNTFVEGLWASARARRVSRETFEAAFAGVAPDPDVIDRSRNQAEFRKTIGQYMQSAVSEQRVVLGRARYAENERTLARAEERFGVDRFVIMGVWGLETKFGTYMGDKSTVGALATLAAARFHGDYFRKELIEALVILQEGHVDPGHMVGSWAGATGQTQFMPSNFHRYAIDFDGDGRRDIWGSVPDAIGSTANFLHKHGWTAGETWGYEAALPEGRGSVETGRFAPFPAWADRGVVRADGGEMPRSGRAALLRPAGAAGPAFLVTPNFKVIKSYNNATSYAVGVGLLGDRIAGGAPLKTPWPDANLAADR